MKRCVILMSICLILCPFAILAQQNESWEEYQRKIAEAEKQDSPLVAKGQQAPKLIPKDVIIEELSKPPQVAPSGAIQGALVVLTSESILFDYGSSRLMESSFLQLAEIAAALRDPRLASIPFFYVDGHTCDIGSESNNCRLSWDRAKSVVYHLITVGRVPPERLKARGFGEYEPMYPNTSELNRRLNRRVVLQSGSAVLVTRDARFMCPENASTSGIGGSQLPPSGYRPSQSHYPTPVDEDSSEPVFAGLRGGKGKLAPPAQQTAPQELKKDSIPGAFKPVGEPKTQQSPGAVKGIIPTAPSNQ